MKGKVVSNAKDNDNISQEVNSVSGNNGPLSFYGNGGGVSLWTKHGALHFSTEEFAYYDNLFKVANTDSNRALNAYQSTSLLLRSELDWVTIERIIIVTKRALLEIGGTSSNGAKEVSNNKEISFVQFLMICKYIAYIQSHPRKITERLFKELHHTINATHEQLFANFCLSSVKENFGKTNVHSYREYRVNVIGWQKYGEDYQNQHIKYQLAVTSTWKQNIFPSANNGGNSVGVELYQTNFIVERRYSEFESFMNILVRQYKGIVFPSLPSKSWYHYNKNNYYYTNNNSGHNLTNIINSIPPQSENIILQRKEEFQMLLNHLLRHPLMRFSFELKTFLETTSSAALKAFFDLYNKQLPVLSATIAKNSSHSGMIGATLTGEVSPDFAARANTTTDKKSSRSLSISSDYFIETSSESSGNSGNIMKIISESASSLTTNITTSKAAEYLTSLWSNVSKNINATSTAANSRWSLSSSSAADNTPSIAVEANGATSSISSPTTTQSTSLSLVSPPGTTAGVGHRDTYNASLLEEDAVSVQFNFTKKFMESVAFLAEKTEKYIIVDNTRMIEMLRLAEIFKTMSESESASSLSKALKLAQVGFTSLNKIQEQSFTQVYSVRVVIPINFAARYLESFKFALAQREKVQEIVQQQHIKEIEAKKYMESLKAKLPSNRLNSRDGIAQQGKVSQDPENILQYDVIDADSFDEFNDDVIDSNQAVTGAEEHEQHSTSSEASSSGNQEKQQTSPRNEDIASLPAYHSPTNGSLSSSVFLSQSMVLQVKEEQYSQAAMDYARAEDRHEHCKRQEQLVTQLIREECEIVKTLQISEVLKSMEQLAKEKLAATRKMLQSLEQLKESFKEL